jgi:hypothetical protein
MADTVTFNSTLGVSFHEDDSKWCGSVRPGAKGRHVGPLDNPRLEGYGYQVVEVLDADDVTDIPQGWAAEVVAAKRLVVVCRTEQFDIE